LPISAKQAALTSPTYPVPTMHRFIAYALCSKVSVPAPGPWTVPRRRNADAKRRRGKKPCYNTYRNCTCQHGLYKPPGLAYTEKNACRPRLFQPGGPMRRAFPGDSRAARRTTLMQGEYHSASRRQCRSRGHPASGAARRRTGSGPGRLPGRTLGGRSHHRAPARGSPATSRTCDVSFCAKRSRPGCTWRWPRRRKCRASPCASFRIWCAWCRRTGGN
jgi:hypothetical protein